ncbi:MAG: single-stranded DNA-binding protein [Gammaproteobacteria bacterium]|nr:single-stranded DNA-binding protein [Gammaproteobacteria bacterium]
MSFADLKAKAMKLDSLVGAAEQDGGKKESYAQDERKWKPTRDKSGNGYAVIRFLPAKEGDDLPWAKYWDHFFKGPTGQWYVEKSLTTIGKDDPVSEMNTKLWNSGIESDKQIARDRKRRLHYVSNIYVVNDPANPENEGKVFLYEYGKKIFDKIMDSMRPQFQDETPVNPFDLWKGANFKIKIAKVEGYVNYDRSSFDAPTPLAEDSQLEAIYNQEYSLKEFTDETTFKPYDELKLKLTRVLGEAGAVTSSAESMELEDSVTTTTPTPEIKKPPVDDTMSYFEKLAAEA